MVIKLGLINLINTNLFSFYDNRYVVCIVYILIVISVEHIHSYIITI